MGYSKKKGRADDWRNLDDVIEEQSELADSRDDIRDPDSVDDVNEKEKIVARNMDKLNSDEDDNTQFFDPDETIF